MFLNPLGVSKIAICEPEVKDMTKLLSPVGQGFDTDELNIRCSAKTADW